MFANACQELLSAERCPTLSVALPIYEKLVAHWTALTETIPELAHYIRLGIGKIMEYVANLQWVAKHECMPWQ